MTPYEIKKISESAFENQGNALGKECYIQRLIDNSDLMNRGNRGHASLPRQPADFIVMLKGLTFFAEVKGTEQDKFYLSRFEPSQWAGMMRSHAAGGNYNIFIYHVPSKLWTVVSAEYILKLSAENVKSFKLESKVDDWTKIL